MYKRKKKSMYMREKEIYGDMSRGCSYVIITATFTCRGTVSRENQL